jgi:molybdopterin-containing oxidoreductase family iron-sulfur binding subunit
MQDPPAFSSTARDPVSEKRLWRSLDELAGSPEVMARIEAEFPDIAQAGTLDRRTWLRLMGASVALAGLPGCGNEPVLGQPPLIAPAASTPGYVPGTPVWIATSLELAGYGRGVLVKSQEGRPIKIEGNPLHPASLGATDVFAQAEVLSLYDPDRSRAPTENGIESTRKESTWESFERFLRPMRDELVAEKGRGLHLLLPPLASPTVERLVGAARRILPHARWYRHGPISDDARHAGAVLAFGRPVDLVHDLTQADVIVTLGGDLFATEPGHIRHAADFQARRRDPGRPLPRLVALESTPSLAGARADETIALRPRDIEIFARSLASLLAPGSAPATNRHPAATRIAEDLRRAGPRGLVVVGREQPAAVHALGHAMNLRLGAFGTTLRAIAPVLPGPTDEESIVALADAIASGGASRLLILGGNPAYDAPTDLDFAGLLGRVPVSLHLGYHRDETAAACLWHVPQCHSLEAFGDIRAFDGTVGLRQPATLRLAPSLSLEEAIGLLLEQAPNGRDMLAATWRERSGEDFENLFARFLEEGVVPETAAPSIAVALQEGWDRGPAASAVTPRFDVVFAPDPSVWDGRFANNAWLQELPKPLTKQVWGNAALIAPATAEALGVSTGDMIEITVAGRNLAAPVWVDPGHAPDTVTLPLGYGRRRAGSVGNGVGFDAYRLRTSQSPWIAPGEIVPLGSRGDLVSTQHHHALPDRSIVRVVTPDQPDAGDRTDPRPSLYPPWRYEGHAWGMTIDLDACLGCNACVIACQAENNVSVVGPEQVARGREMHWLRIDRYYGGSPDEPNTYFQPVPCMHCEKAPCEVVCPVNATVHSSEGLNDMVYNRCIGTRTCSNNCPYKVRRFNFLDNRATGFATPDDALNPHVTVRERGVMEKCTYCVQRIGAARAAARVEDRSIGEGEVVTACQQACPTQAIVFGDANDPDSAVSRLKRSPRNYALLGDLNTQPRTTYLARIESPEPSDGDGS